MDELKTLIEAVAGLPSLTVWVLVGFLIYKLATLASLYAVIQLAIVKLHDWLKTRHDTKEVRPMLDGVVITGGVHHLMAVLKGIVGVASNSSNYIHSSDISWLYDAIEEKKEREAKK